MKDSKIRAETIKCLEENVSEIFIALQLAIIFWIRHQKHRYWNSQRLLVGMLKWCSCCGKQFGSSSKSLTWNYCDSTVLLLVICPKGIEKQGLECRNKVLYLHDAIIHLPFLWMLVIKRFLACIFLDHLMAISTKAEGACPWQWLLMSSKTSLNCPCAAGIHDTG